MSEANTSISELTKEFKGIKTFDQELASDTTIFYKFDCPVIDIPLGGGIAGGKIYEVYGWESVGKSTYSLEMTKAFSNYFKKQGNENYAILWIEAESSLDRVRAKWMGCPIDTNFLVCEPDYFEEAETFIMGVLEKAFEKGLKVLIVWDTISATPTEKEATVGANAGGMMEKPRKARQLFRKVVSKLGRTNSTMILINQYNASLDPNKVGDTPIPAIKFYASVRTRMTRRAWIKKLKPDTADEYVSGIVTELFHEKNKLTQRGQKSLIDIDNENGIDLFATNVRYLKTHKLISVKGAGWANIQVPERLFDKKKNEKIEFVDVKFQTNAKLKEIIETKYSHLKDWIDYLIYLNHTKVSPLVKIRIIRDVWKYEKMFFGQIKTVLEDDEKEAASIIFKDQNDIQDMEYSAFSKDEKGNK